MELVEPGPTMTQPRPRDPKKTFTLLGPANRRVLAGTQANNPYLDDFVINEVPDEFALAWFKRNEDLEFVRNGSVFMVSKASAAQGEAKDRRGILTGLEPLKAEGDSRTPQGISWEDEQRKRLSAIAAQNASGGVAAEIGAA
jgi:hypothetical protein